MRGDKVPLSRLKGWVHSKVTRNPRWGKFLARFMSYIEVASLEVLTFLDRYLIPGVFRRVMRVAKGSWGSVVVPLGVNIDPSVQISPTEEIFEIVKRVDVVALGACYCRWRNGDRKYPSETCIILGRGYDLEDLAAAGKLVPGTEPRRISVDELRHVLEVCDRAGLVHQLIFFPSPRFFYVICNCAPESCTALQNVIKFGAPSVVKSNFVESTDAALCTACGACVGRCPFGARSLDGASGGILVDANRCYGCGVCVPTCPEGAIRLVRR
ncbi:MAG: 4Fe-4S binding protein [Promethearchaeota archaeon]